MAVRTDNVERELVTWYELPDNERENHDYIDPDSRSDLNFFKYNDAWYHLGDFLAIKQEDYSDWQGMMGTSYFSAILVKFADDSREHLIVGEMNW